RVAEIGVDAEGEEARTARFAQVGVLLVQHRHADPERRQVRLEYVVSGRGIEAVERGWRGEVAKRPRRRRQRVLAAVVVLVVGDQLLARAARQRGADRYRTV